ncbi:tetratricopeptide repeat protein [Asanoa siamensis]|uniref:Tetratricopeptide repeat protein n=1 Tax=Asanoa siamensis TaxID=926357 RepID=A0ABQ4CIT8_9ACTN|nr:tetratricopeptide repeat protein [Asanoa siamensis]GIF71215.1 hypothetical protein Asi02nite_07330 [Asanoa siamensis]
MTDDRLRRAWAAYRAGDLATARQRAEEAGRADDPAVQGAAFTLRGLCRVRLDSADEDLFAQAVRRFEATPRPDRRFLAEYGIALTLSGRFDEAEPVLRRAVTLGAAGPDVLRCLARVLSRQGDDAGAGRAIAAAARAYPADWLVAHDRAELLTGRAELLTDRPPVAADAWAVAGALSLAAGRGDVALAAYSRALELTPDDPHLLAEKARACAFVGDVEELFATLGRSVPMKASELVPMLFEASEPLVRAAPDVARALLERTIEVEPEHAGAHALLGIACRDLGDDAAADRAFDEAVRLDPDDARALLARGQLRLARGQHDEAIADLELAAAAQPRAGLIRLTAAEAYYIRAEDTAADADVERALAHLRVALEIKPGDAAALRLVGYVTRLRRDADPATTETALRAARAANPDDPSLAYYLGLLLFDQGAYEEALGCAEQAVAGLPDSPLARLLRGQLLRTTGDPERALPDLEAAAEGQPDLPEAHAALGEAYRIVGRFDAALAELTTAVEAQPDDGWSLASRGATRHALGDVTGALADLRRSLGRGAEPGFAVWWLCEALRGSVDEDALVDEIGAAAALHLDEPDVLEIYSDVLHGAGRYGEAVDAAERGLMVRPDHVGLLRSLGWARLALGDRARAVETLERAAALHGDVTTLTDLATMVARGDDAAEALRTIDRGLAVARTSALLRLRAEVFAGLADWAAAREAAAEALVVEPVDPWAHWEFGRALRYLDGGLPDEALAAFEAMREREPDNPMGPQGIGDVHWTVGRRAEAEVAYRAAIALYESFGEDEAWTRHGIGWCLHRLGRYAPAAESYLLALPASDERSALLFDIGLNWLAAGEEVRAADAYAQGFGVLSAMPRTRVAGMLAVAAEDLRASVARGVVADTAQVADLRDRLAKETATASGRRSV